MERIGAVHFLQEYEVGIERAQTLAQVVDSEAPVAEGEALVDVVGRDAEGLHALVKMRHRRSMTVAGAISDHTPPAVSTRSAGLRSRFAGLPGAHRRVETACWRLTISSTSAPKVVSTLLRRTQVPMSGG